MKFYTWLLESEEINLSKKIYKTLSKDARRAIDEWEMGGWDEGRLSKAIKTNSEIVKEIVEAFTPIREFLKKKYGQKIKLFRGLIKSDESPKKVLFSWTSDKKVAERFAGLRTTGWREMLKDPISDSDIKKIVDTYNKKGFVSFRGYKYIQIKDSPEYYNIYKGNENLTDGNDLYKSLKDEQKYIDDHNKKILDKAVILEENVDIDKILWITNKLNSKEFIVAYKKLV